MRLYSLYGIASIAYLSSSLAIRTPKLLSFSTKCVGWRPILDNRFKRVWIVSASTARISAVTESSNKIPNRTWYNTFWKFHWLKFAFWKAWTAHMFTIKGQGLEIPEQVFVIKGVSVPSSEVRINPLRIRRRSNLAQYSAKSYEASEAARLRFPSSVICRFSWLAAIESALAF